MKLIKKRTEDILDEAGKTSGRRCPPRTRTVCLKVQKDTDEGGRTWDFGTKERRPFPGANLKAVPKESKFYENMILY